MATLDVHLVAADRVVWNGNATSVIARTTEGDIGILPDHEEFLAVLTDGEVIVRAADQDDIYAHVDGGFISAEHNTVMILAEQVSTSEPAAKPGH